jgi:hypothetical protein
VNELEAVRERMAVERRRLRHLAREMADRADAIASTMEQSALMHDRMAGLDGHPLQGRSAKHAVEERRIAAFERSEAVRLRGVADTMGDEVPRAAP